MSAKAKIKIVVEDSVDKALRQLKKRCIDYGITRDVRRTAIYEKPSDAKKRSITRKLKLVQKYLQDTKDKFRKI